MLVLERRAEWAGDQVGRQTELVLLAPELPENPPRPATDVIDPPRIARGKQELRAIGTHVERIDVVRVPRLTRSRGSRNKRIAQGDVLGHVPGEDQLPSPQIDFVEYIVFIRPVLRTAVGGQIRLDGFRHEEIGVTLLRNQELVQVRRGSVRWSDRHDLFIVLVVDHEVATQQRRASGQVARFNPRDPSLPPDQHRLAEQGLSLEVDRLRAVVAGNGVKPDRIPGGVHDQRAGLANQYHSGCLMGRTARRRSD